jgi:hypothetical protein
MRNITLSADGRLIKAARKKAQEEHTTMIPLSSQPHAGRIAPPYIAKIFSMDSKSGE